MIDGLAAAASSLGDVGLGDKLLTLNSQDPNTCHCLGLSGSRSNGLEQGRGVTVDIKRRMPVEYCDGGIVESSFKEQVAGCLIDRPIENQNEVVCCKGTSSTSP